MCVPEAEAAVWPSPKSQRYCFGSVPRTFDEKEIDVRVSGFMVEAVIDTMSAFAHGSLVVTAQTLLEVPFPLPLVAVKVTSYEPARVKVCEAVSPVAVEPSPKFHVPETGCVASGLTDAENVVGWPVSISRTGQIRSPTSTGTKNLGVKLKPMTCHPRRSTGPKPAS